MDQLNTPEIPEKRIEEPVLTSEPFSLPIEDTDLITILNRKIADSEAFYKDKLKLEDRRKTNEDFWLGKQLDESQFYDWQVPYKDNLIYQDLETRLAIASSRMPDVLVTPADPEKRENAKNLEQALNIKMGRDEVKRIIKGGLRDLHLYFQGVLKCRWDKTTSDFVFDKVRPHKIIVDHTASIPEDGFTADRMDFIAEWIEEPIGVVSAKFPNKKEELLKQLAIIRQTTKQMVSKIKYLEVWFTWYDKDGNLFEGVCWKYKNIILDKMKHPYWDWKGYPATNDKTQTIYS